uniref:SFRICE_016252 n=1 Tax=Spodoptera frugiperda TaxID=7108 RepID=A0A2H1WK36_SPOFR
MQIFFIYPATSYLPPIFTNTIQLKSNANPSQQKEINVQINKLLDDNIIEKCNSCWSSPLLLVPKKMDSSGQKKFRLLNNLIEDDKYPLLNMTEIRTKGEAFVQQWTSLG